MTPSGTPPVPSEGQSKPERRRTGRGPRVRYHRDGEADPVIVVFPDDADGIEVLESCFKKHGMTITPESAARCDQVLRERANRPPTVAEHLAMKEKQRKTRWKK